MTTLSVPTLGLLIEIADDLFTKSKLENLLMRSSLSYDKASPNKAELLRSAFLGVRDRAEGGDRQAHRGLLKFILLLVEERVDDPERPRPAVRLDELREALLADGYQLHWEHEPDATNPFFGGGTYRFQLLPTDAAPVPLAPEISALEAELTARGYNDALNNYQQAVDNFVHHNYEAANGQLRTALEDLVTRLARQHTGYVGQGKAGEGGNAINYMVTTGGLPERDGGKLLQGIWQMTHTRGSHPGQSDADEARFRMLIITAIARFLLNHFP
jgi:hypothetical protein